jgi:hypothetical protein
VNYHTPVTRAGRTIAIFHFHAHFDLCRPRIELLRALNPGLEIFGLYGGPASSLSEARALRSAGLADVHHDLETASPRGRWKDTDIAVAGWFRHVGRECEFERVHVVQWDLLFFASFDRAYPPLPKDAVALSGLVPLAEVADFWDWMVLPGLSDDSRRFLTQTRQRYGCSEEPLACVGPGYSLSRAFLDRFSDLDLDDLGHDELRLPLFAQILKMELVDTGFYPRWMDPDVEKGFNADAHEIDPDIVREELSRVGGRRVFHPCRESFGAATIERLLASSVDETTANDHV